MSNISSKSNKKLIPLTRVVTFLLFKKRVILAKDFTESQFKCCPLVWMFDGRQINNNINKVHKRAKMYNDTITLFKELLVKGKTFTIHHQTI